MAELIDYLHTVKDTHCTWMLTYTLPEIMLLVLFATLANADDSGQINVFGNAYINVLRQFLLLKTGSPRMTGSKHSWAPLTQR